MALTVNDVITRARSHLNDAVTPYRYTDSDLVAFVNDAVVEAQRHRPDFFVGAYDKDHFVTGLADEYPLPTFTLHLTSVFVAGMAELRDDEHANTGRSNALVGKFVSGLKTAAA